MQICIARQADRRTCGPPPVAAPRLMTTDDDPTPAAPAPEAAPAESGAARTSARARADDTPPAEWLLPLEPGASILFEALVDARTDRVYMLPVAAARGFYGLTGEPPVDVLVADARERVWTWRFCAATLARPDAESSRCFALHGVRPTISAAIADHGGRTPSGEAGAQAAGAEAGELTLVLGVSARTSAFVVGVKRESPTQLAPRQLALGDAPATVELGTQIALEASQCVREVEGCGGSWTLPLEPSARILFSKKLTHADASRLGRLVVPKHIATVFFRGLGHNGPAAVRVNDSRRQLHMLRFRRWTNPRTPPMHVLEGMGTLFRTLGPTVHQGDFFVLAIDETGHFQVGVLSQPPPERPGVAACDGSAAEPMTAARDSEEQRSFLARFVPRGARARRGRAAPGARGRQPSTGGRPPPLPPHELLAARAPPVMGEADVVAGDAAALAASITPGDDAAAEYAPQLYANAGGRAAVDEESGLLENGVHGPSRADAERHDGSHRWPPSEDGQQRHHQRPLGLQPTPPGHMRLHSTSGPPHRYAG